MIISSEIFSNWVWDKYHILALLVCIIAIGMLVFIIYDSINYKRNHPKLDTHGKTKR
jgi:uncharacterized protein YoxC